MIETMVLKDIQSLWLVQETRVWFLGQEDPLEEGNGNPLQYSCLENPMDRGAWWAAVREVAESDTTEHTCTYLYKNSPTETLHTTVDMYNDAATRENSDSFLKS